MREDGTFYEFNAYSFYFSDNGSLLVAGTVDGPQIKLRDCIISNWDNMLIFNIMEIIIISLLLLILLPQNQKN